MVSRDVEADDGFDGLLRPDHMPTLAGESNNTPGYEMQGNLFAVGYIRGILDALNLSVVSKQI